LYCCHGDKFVCAYCLTYYNVHVCFSDLIGEGTFSKVYHGVCMGTEVAIKQLKIPLTTHDKNYFAAEVNLYTCTMILSL